MLRKLASVFDKWFSKSNIDRLDDYVVRIAIAGLLLHLVLIYVNNWFLASKTLTEVFGQNPLAAMYTPFSFVLFFEVLLMVIVIPESFSRSIGAQFQIMALIIVRSSLKELGGLGDANNFQQDLPVLKTMVADLATGLSLYLMILIYFWLSRLKMNAASSESKMSERLQKFIDLKKAVALTLSVVLLLAAIISLGHWLSVLQAIVAGATNLALPNVNSVFYQEYFLIIIFVDIFLVLYSMKENPGFTIVFRNIGFVVSTIIMRFYFVAPRPYNLLAVIGGVLFSLITFAISIAYARLEQKDAIVPVDVI